MFLHINLLAKQQKSLMGMAVSSFMGILLPIGLMGPLS
jgi:hypothetical protein